MNNLSWHRAKNITPVYLTTYWKCVFLIICLFLKVQQAAPRKVDVASLKAQLQRIKNESNVDPAASASTSSSSLASINNATPAAYKTTTPTDANPLNVTVARARELAARALRRKETREADEIKQTLIHSQDRWVSWAKNSKKSGCFLSSFSFLVLFQDWAASIPAVPHPCSGSPPWPVIALSIQGSGRDVQEYGDCDCHVVQPLWDRHLQQDQAGRSGYDAQVCHKMDAPTQLRST